MISMYVTQLLADVIPIITCIILGISSTRCISRTCSFFYFYNSWFLFIYSISFFFFLLLFRLIHFGLRNFSNYFQTTISLFLKENLSHAIYPFIQSDIHFEKKILYQNGVLVQQCSINCFEAKRYFFFKNKHIPIFEFHCHFLFSFQFLYFILFQAEKLVKRWKIFLKC